MPAKVKKQILVFKNNAQICPYLMEVWQSIGQQAIRENNRFTLAISGGKTPLEFYRYLSEKAGAFCWDKIHIFMVDERLVPFEHRESNFGVLKENLLRQITIPQENMHQITVAQDALTSAGGYAQELKSFFALNDEEFPQFDLIVLGIGEDGHTASLFPGQKALGERQGLATAVSLKHLTTERVTLTLPVINHAKNIIFVVTGAHKAKIIQEVIAGKALLPASLVNLKQGKMFFLLDSAAAALLDKGKYVLK